MPGPPRDPGMTAFAAHGQIKSAKVRRVLGLCREWQTVERADTCLRRALPLGAHRQADRGACQSVHDKLGKKCWVECAPAVVMPIGESCRVCVGICQAGKALVSSEARRDKMDICSKFNRLLCACFILTC